MLRQRKQGNEVEGTKIPAVSEKSCSKSTDSDRLFWAQAAATALFLTIVRAMIGFISQDGDPFEVAMSTYGFYHQHPLNKVIHFFGIPVLLWSALLLVAHIPLPFVPNLTFSTATFVLYNVFYLALDITGAILFFPVMLAMYWSSVRWTGKPGVIPFALGLQVLSWYAQIHPGHLIVEGGRPALVDGLGEALTVGPIFAFYEGLWALGINPELQQRADRAIHSLSVEKCAANPSITYVCNSLRQEVQ